jgi:hypothetical protein
MQFDERQRESLWWIDEAEWSLWCGDHLVATHDTFDIQRAQHLWSIVPGWDALPTWWAWADEALERGEITQEVYDAPVNALVAKWRWCHGEISDEELTVACDAARDILWGADGPGYGLVVRDAVWAIVWACREGLDAARDAVWAVWVDAYQRYCDQFTEYVWYLIQEDKK